MIFKKDEPEPQGGTGSELNFSSAFQGGLIQQCVLKSTSELVHSEIFAYKRVRMSCGASKFTMAAAFPLDSLREPFLTARSGIATTSSCSRFREG